MRFRHDGNGDTQIEGDAEGGSFGDPIFYLPAAYWPTVTQPRIAGVTSDGAPVVVTVSSVDGAVALDEFLGGGSGDADAVAADLAAHIADPTAAHAATAVSASSTTLVGTATTVQGVLEELDNGIADHLADTSAAHAATAISADSTTLAGTGTTVQAVFEELDNAIADHLADTSGAHGATAISIVDSANDFAATDVEGALAELQTADEADEAALAAHIADTTAAHTATAIGFTPAGTISATTVQAAIEEVSSESGGAPAADDVTITDAGNYFTATDVEGALQEVGAATAPNADDVPFTPAGTIAATDVQAAIVEVAAESGGGIQAPGFRTGATLFYLPSGGMVAGGPVQNALTVYPVWLPAGLPIDRLLVDTTANGGAGSVIRLGIYEDNGYGEPDALLIDAGTFAAASGNGAGKSITVAPTLAYTGWYWLAYVAQGSATAPGVRCLEAPGAFGAPFMWSVGTSAPGGLEFNGYTTTASSTLPDPFGATTPYTSNPARVYIRVT